MFDDALMVGDCGDLDGVLTGWWQEFQPRWIAGIVQETVDNLFGYLGIPAIDVDLSFLDRPGQT